MQNQESETENNEIMEKSEKCAIKENNKAFEETQNAQTNKGNVEDMREENIEDLMGNISTQQLIDEVKTEESDVPCDTAFNVRITEEKLNTVCIEWDLLVSAEVYKIEKYHRRYGWQQMAWIGQPPATLENLAENFTYRLRIKAQRFCTEIGLFVDYKVSPDFLVTTLPPLPTTLSLHRAIKKGQQFLVKRILRRRPSLLEYPGPNGYLPLANAIISGEHCVTDVLLSHGASVHIGNPLNGRTPLQLAFYHGRLAVARILLNRKAQLEATDINGMTACHFAVDANQLELLRFALENGGNVNAKDACGWSLLSRAVVMGADVCVLKLLLTHGADAKSTDKLAKTCMDLAKIYKNFIAADFLAKALRPK
ncbi:unnamed protein product [Ceratitis capitata]|uniref:(Mediterranean fruit fly) hypothetical protein n=1 Tax=Ceratitis capitata TaxID=7213 RepID=A0A811U399_CERCA|nr:unnamed protein product [Ceratitis capitata]